MYKELLDVYCRIDNAKLNSAVIEILHEADADGEDSPYCLLKSGGYPYLFYNPKYLNGSTAASSVKGKRLVSIENFIELGLKYGKFPPIMIGEHNVVFEDDGIWVGCEFVDRETVNEIYERLNACYE